MKYKLIFSMIKFDKDDVVHQVLETSQVVFMVPDEAPVPELLNTVHIAVAEAEAYIYDELSK